MLQIGAMKRRLKRAFDDLGAYLVLEVLLPCGVLAALIGWLYRHSS